MSLLHQFKQNWKRLYPFTRPALLAVSGGLDSMVMAHLFLNADIEFAVAHCNFGLRDQESDSDEVFVKSWCTQNKIRCFATRFDTKKIAEASGKGTQETARDLRYQWFETIATHEHLGAICTAHHADDNAETLLMNLCRGTGIAGLHGIPERNGLVARPLLFTNRKALQEYAGREKIDFREDSSNQTDDYLRNAVRHHILPLVEQYMPGASARMLQTGKHVGEAEIIYKRAIEQTRKKLLQQRGKDYYVPLNLLKNRTPLNTICYELFSPFGFTSQQIPSIVEDLFQAESGKQLLSPTHRLIRHREFLIVTTKQQQEADLIPVENFDQSIETSNGQFQFTVLEASPKQLDVAPSVAYIDVAKLAQPVVLRRWKTGDYFYPLGMGMKKKKVSRFLTDQKLPAHEKEMIWVLESSQRIVWVAGLRLDERFKIKPSSTKILRITQRAASV